LFIAYVTLPEINPKRFEGTPNILRNLFPSSLRRI